MTTRAQLRKAALSLPEVEEGTHFGMLAFSVSGKGFVSVTDDDLVQLHLAPDDVDDLLAQHNEADQLTRGQKPLGARVPLGAVNGQQLNHWVRRAWLARAPKRLAAAALASERARAGEVGDLPKAIGNPATRALVAAGITDLDGVAALGADGLRDLHGVGPKAITVLTAALADREKAVGS